MSITALEPARGFKCPISFDTTENPVYLKGCEHFFDRAVIENWFRSKFANADAAPCPMCNRQYGIAKFLPEGREQAIARLFERILIVPIVTHEINRKLAKWENYNHQIVVREQQLEKQSQIIEAQKQRIDEQTQQIESQNQKIASLNTTNETLYKKLKLVNSDISDKTKYNLPFMKYDPNKRYPVTKSEEIKILTKLKEQVRKGGMPGKVVGEFIPTSTGGLVITGGLATAAIFAPPVVGAAIGFMIATIIWK